MPVLQLKITPLANPDRYRQIAQALTALATSVLGKRADVTAVIVEDLPVAQWFIGGASPGEPSAFLEISITAGTNTAQEKAAFIGAAFAELERQLAPGARLAAASYVVVRELPADAWGYAGRTQASRRLTAPAAQ